MNVRGLRLGWAELLKRVTWEAFVTLTFDQKRCFPVSREVAVHEALKWCEYVAYVWRRPVGWAFVVECGKGGQWHVHVLLVGVEGARWDAPEETWKTRNGGIEVRETDDISGVARYSSKSIADEEHGGEVVISDTLSRYVSVVNSNVVDQNSSTS
jgi:hypothetical protein